MIRKAKFSDIRAIQALINIYAKKDLMLARSLNELYEHIRNFWVFVDKNKVRACCALDICWENLAEIKSLAVDPKFRLRGIGSSLVLKAIEEAANLGVKKIFVLTYAPKFFKRFGFKKISTKLLPHKVWNDCFNCPKFPDCKEVALMKKI
ncbi:MAG: N-acetyltransferase [Candidatus Omnitrophota bacterium]